MHLRTIACFVSAIALAAPASAVAAVPAASPYAGQQTREIKALSSEEVDGYLAGKGMGLAKEVDEERKLDSLFAGRTATAALLKASLDRIGALQAELRAVHLEAHLAQVQILTPEQNAQYAQLRGYDAGAHGSHGEHHQH
jgi:hypothetical protein